MNYQMLDSAQNINLGQPHNRFLPQSNNIAYFDCLPPVLWDAVLEVQLNTGAPIALVINSSLATLSAAAQAHFNVERPGGLVGPIALFLFIIAVSGEGKTTLDNIFTKPIREFEREQFALTQADNALFKARLERWNAELRAIKRGIERDALDGIEDHHSAELRLVNLMMKKPQEPPSRRSIYEDATPAALKSGLANWPSAVVLSDEGAKVMNGLLFEEPGLLNSLWSGSELNVSRVGSGQSSTPDPRLTISIMVQPGIFKAFIEKKKGVEFREIGMFARFLIANPVSTQGFRFTDGREPNWDKLHVFHDRIKQILAKSTAARIAMGDDHEFAVLKMSPAAKELWIHQARNAVESQVAPGGYLYPVRDFAAKIGDQVARIAGLFHLLAGNEESEISEVTLGQSLNLMRHFEQEFLKLFAKPPEPDQTMTDAQALLQWLHARGCHWIPKTQLRQLCPNALRQDGRFLRALDYLQAWGFVVVDYERTPHGIGKKLFVWPVYPAPYHNGAFGQPAI